MMFNDVQWCNVLRYSKFHTKAWGKLVFERFEKVRLQLAAGESRKSWIILIVDICKFMQQVSKWSVVQTSCWDSTMMAHVCADCESPSRYCSNLSPITSNQFNYFPLISADFDFVARIHGHYDTGIARMLLKHCSSSETVIPFASPNFLRTLKCNFCIFYQKLGVPNPEGELAMGFQHSFLEFSARAICFCFHLCTDDASPAAGTVPWKTWQTDRQHMTTIDNINWHELHSGYVELLLLDQCTDSTGSSWTVP